MRPYSQISPQWWTGSTGREITRIALIEDENAYTRAMEVRTLGVWLMTGSMHNQYGLYYAPLVLIQAETGIRPSRMQGAMTTLADLQFAVHDDLTQFVWVREMAAWQLNLPLKDGDKQIGGAGRWYRGCPDNPFLGAFHDRYAADLRLDIRREPKGVTRGLNGGSEGQDLSPSLSFVPSPSDGKGPGETQQVPSYSSGQLRHAAIAVITLWNDRARDPFLAISEAPGDLRRIDAALRSHPDLDWWAARFDQVMASDWFAGNNPRGWVTDFWWVLEHGDEVAAGRGRNRQAARPKATQTWKERCKARGHEPLCGTPTACELRNGQAASA